jgi:hypothetical protein
VREGVEMMAQLPGAAPAIKCGGDGTWGAPGRNGAELGDEGRQSERNLASAFNPGWRCSPCGTGDVRFVPLRPDPCALALEPGSCCGRRISLISWGKTFLSPFLLLIFGTKFNATVLSDCNVA